MNHKGQAKVTCKRTRLLCGLVKREGPKKTGMTEKKGPKGNQADYEWPAQRTHHGPKYTSSIGSVIWIFFQTVWQLCLHQFASLQWLHFHESQEPASFAVRVLLINKKNPILWCQFIAQEYSPNPEIFPNHRNRHLRIVETVKLRIPNYFFRNPK